MKSKTRLDREKYFYMNILDPEHDNEAKLIRLDTI
jgi:hypothetical protein